MAGRAAGGHGAAGLKNNGLSLSAGRANNNQPPHHPKKETILRVQTAGREELGETGTKEGVCEEIQFLQLIFDHLKLLFGV